jgi:hypothetical protein
MTRGGHPVFFRAAKLLSKLAQLTFLLHSYEIVLVTDDPLESG